ncbi:MAG: hypothetical protein JO338_01280 [Aquitalea sp.]|nr:hypothetical protein [Aquitalea sp.]
MAARLMQALLLPAVLGLLSMAAPMQPLQALPVSSLDSGRVLLPALPSPWVQATGDQSVSGDGLQQIVMAAPPFTRLRDGYWQVALGRPAVTLKLQSNQRLLYAWRLPRVIIPRPPAAQAVAVILDKSLPTADLGRLLLDAGHMGAFQAGVNHGISHILLLDGAGENWVTPRMLPAVRWQGGATSFQILQRVCRME